MSENPEVEKILVDIKDGANVPQSKIKEYCEKKYGHRVVSIDYGDITWVHLDDGQIVTFFELQDYVRMVEKLHEVEQKLNSEGS